MIEPQMKNPYTYCFTTEVPYYQCDLSGKMKLSWLLKVMERAAGEHLEHLGLPYDRLYQEGIVFLLSKADHMEFHLAVLPKSANQLADLGNINNIVNRPQVTKANYASSFCRTW